MRVFLFCCLTSICLAATTQRVFSQQIFINEFLASNSNVLADETGDYDDWVELFNPGPLPVNIAGMYVTDNLNQPTQWRIPDTDAQKTTIAPGGFLLLWFDKEMAQGPLHVNAKLSADGEDIGLFAADGVTLIDGLTFGPQSSNVSYGRVPDGGPAFQFFPQPTPNEPNQPAIGGEYAEKPLASVDGGFFNTSFELVLSTTMPDAEIRYTLDGSLPANSSALYSAPLTITQTTTLRAVTFAPGFLPSQALTHTYLFENEHVFPVMALSFNEDDFFDPATGIYENFLEDWERPVSVEFFEEDSTAFNQEAVVEIHGTGSAQNAQKSLRIKAKANGGSGFFEHPVFPDLDFDRYKTLVLRNSGQDWNVTMFRDAFVSSLAGDLSDVGSLIERPRLYLQGFRPSVVYLNGKYWGIYNIREHVSSRYVEQHFDLKPNEFDLLENDNEAKEGDFERWNFFKQFLLSNHFVQDTQFAQLGSFLDLPHFLDYNAFNILIDNGDWPGNNYRRWRERTNDARWRFLTFDLDLSFGLFSHQPDTILWNTGDASSNSLARALDSTSYLWPNPHWATLPLRRAMENAAFRRDFINRTADFLNVLFEPQRMNARIDEFKALYLPEIQRHFDRWTGGWNAWENNLQILRKFADERPQHLRQQFIDYFSEISGTAKITLEVSPPGAGQILFSTVHLQSSNLPWTGEYFAGVDIPVTAVAAPGYVFAGWSAPAMGSQLSGKINLSADTVLIAYFISGSAAKDTIVINEINYNSAAAKNSGDWVELFNPNDHSVDISGWVFQDESGYYNMPGNTVMAPGSYLVLAESKSEFSLIYPGVVNVIGNFGQGEQGFKLSNSSELVQLRNASLEVIDSVRYADKQPWPPAADGTGASLQLVHWELDNALPQSWKADTPTPGSPNYIPFKEQTITFPAVSPKISSAPPFVLYAVASSGLPVSFQVVSGPATVSGNIVTLTGEVGIVTIRASQQGDNLWLPAPDVFQSFKVKGLVGYCEVKAEKPWWEWIERVEFGEIDNLSFKTQVGDFTTVSTKAKLGTTVRLTITPAFSWEVFNEYFRAWIDFNKDGDFDDPGELVLEDFGTSVVSADVLIPEDAVLGSVRMRVAMKRGEYPQPCESVLFGEIEDYTVILVDDDLWNYDAEDIEAKPLLKLSPNPAVSRLALQFFTKYSGPVSLSVVDGNGSNLLSERYHLQQGSHYIELDISTLPAGSYYLMMLPSRQKMLSGIFLKI